MNKYELIEINKSYYDFWYNYNTDKPNRFKIIKAKHTCPACNSTEFARVRSGPIFENEFICFNENVHKNPITWEIGKLYIVVEMYDRSEY